MSPYGVIQQQQQQQQQQQKLRPIFFIRNFKIIGHCCIIQFHRYYNSDAAWILKIENANPMIIFYKNREIIKPCIAR
jgi:hypothetical protein